MKIRFPARIPANTEAAPAGRPARRQRAGLRATVIATRGPLGGFPGEPASPPRRLLLSRRAHLRVAGGMVTSALAMLAAVGGSHCTLVTDAETVGPPAPP